jgi:hypothetical protein
MTTTLAKKPRSLAKLATLIRKELKSAYEAGRKYRRRVGVLLVEARQHFTTKGLPESGKGATWEQWIAKEFTLPETGAPLQMTTARGWMLAVKNGARARASSSLASHTDSRSPHHRDYNPRLDWQSRVRDVQGKLNLDALKREVEDEQRQNRETKALAKKIVDAGYRALAAVCHPDKPGGSTEAMAKLAAARRWLNEQINTL